MTGERISPPEHLTDKSKKKWEEIVDENTIDVAAAGILETYFDASERRDQARVNITEYGALIKDRFGVWKINPAVAIERDSTLIMHRAFRLLGFDQEQRGGDQLKLPYK